MFFHPSDDVPQKEKLLEFSPETLLLMRFVLVLYRTAKRLGNQSLS